MGRETVDFDVAIIGGGPAGASMAAYLAQAGVKCVVFERQLFPREHVGESLVPSSTRVFKDLGFLDKMEEAGFPHKYGALWTAEEGARAYEHGWEGLEADCRADIRFEERQQEGVEQNYTYHVDRGQFDLMLLQHAHELGATVYEGISVRGVDFSDPDFARIKFLMGNRTFTLKARIVVDASGRRTFLGSRLKLKVKDPVFDQYAIHTWFEGYDRGDADFAEYIHVHFLPISNSWIWQIPITGSVTSLGVVTQKKNFAKAKADRERFFWDCVATRPSLHDALKKAARVRPFKDEGDYSYAMKAITGDRFLMIGDSARFVDPIFSTGVSIALNSARFARDDILSALEAGSCGRDSFANYEETIRRGTRIWYEFISVYYRLNVLFTAFIKDSRYRLDVLKLLQGDVYDQETPPVLERMKDLIKQVEDQPNHLWHGLLGDLTADEFRGAF